MTFKQVTTLNSYLFTLINSVIIILMNCFSKAIKHIGDDFIYKNLSNIITSTRIIFAICILFTSPFSIYFWTFYVLCGISDILDGVIARKLKQESDLGAKLDSIADFLFLTAVVIVIFTKITVQEWIWIFVVIIALIRFISYGIGYYKYHTFSTLHTYFNKATGLFLFICPVLILIFGIHITAIFICIIAFLAALEELLIRLKSKTINRYYKSIISRT